MRKLPALTVVVSLSAVALVVVAASATPPTISVVMSGLDNRVA